MSHTDAVQPMTTREALEEALRLFKDSNSYAETIESMRVLIDSLPSETPRGDTEGHSRSEKHYEVPMPVGTTIPRMRAAVKDGRGISEGCQLEQELAGAEGRIREIEEDYDRISSLLAAAQSASGDTARLDLIEKTCVYPWKDFGCWKFRIGKTTFSGATAREALDAALSSTAKKEER